jgi:hypothetical protein
MQSLRLTSCLLLGFIVLHVINFGFLINREILTSQCALDVDARFSLASSCNSNSSQIFDQIYITGHWGSKIPEIEDTYNNARYPPRKREPASGGGSSLGHETSNSLDVLRKTIQKYKITSMVDIPCGDTNWIFDSFETDSLPLYIGLDVSSEIIDFNEKKYAHHKNKIFHTWDGSDCATPNYLNNSVRYTVELIHSRDVLQHLSFSQAKRFLCNVVLSKSRYVITTTFNSRENIDIKEGQTYQNNLELAPFFFPKGKDCEDTHPQHEPDKTCTYDLQESIMKNWSRVYCSKV